MDSEDEELDPENFDVDAFADQMRKEEEGKLFDEVDKAIEGHVEERASSSKDDPRRQGVNLEAKATSSSPKMVRSADEGLSDVSSLYTKLRSHFTKTRRKWHFPCHFRAISVPVFLLRKAQIFHIRPSSKSGLTIPPPPHFNHSHPSKGTRNETKYEAL